MTRVWSDAAAPADGGYSSSAQISWRGCLRLVASITTARAPESNEAPGSVFVGKSLRAKAAGVSRPGTRVMMSEPGLKPSLRFSALGSIGTPAALVGICVSDRSRRLPVAVVGSGFVKWSFGHGYRQAD